MNIIAVTCALIFKNDRVLLVQRSESMNLPLEWEFPGGKIEENETEENCLIREIKEELEIVVAPIKRLTPVSFSYPSKSITLIPFICQWQEGEINLTEHKQFNWVKLSDLLTYKLCAADIPIAEEIVRLQK